MNTKNHQHSCKTLRNKLRNKSENQFTLWYTHTKKVSHPGNKLAKELTDLHNEHYNTLETSVGKWMNLETKHENKLDTES